LVSRCIFQILRDEVYIDIRVPFGNRIKWMDTSNRRNPSLFMDLVIAFTGMNRYQRERDSEGYYLATEDDFQAAKALFTDKDGEELVKRLTKKERESLEFLVSRPDGITQDDLAERLKVSRQRAGQILFGQPKGSGGLMGKVPIKESSISDTITIGDGERRTIHKTVYSLKDYDKFAGFDAIVRLEPLPVEPCKGARDGARDSARIDTASSDIDERDEREKREEREKKKEEGLHLPSSLKGQVLHENEVCPCKPCTVAADIDARPCTVLSSPLQPLHHDEPTRGAVQSQDPGEKGVTSPEEKKARLWDSIRSKLKKCGRVDGKRRGIAVADLQPDEIELIQNTGWQRETTGTGISIFWIPEKAAAAMKLEAPA